MRWKKNRLFFHGTYSNLTAYLFFYQYILKYLNGFQNLNFSVLWLKWIQTMEMKQKQAFFHGAYSNLTPFFLSKHIKVFQWLSKSKFLNFMTKVNPNNGNETKPDIFSVGHIQIMLKYSNEFHNYNVSISF